MHISALDCLQIPVTFGWSESRLQFGVAGWLPETQYLRTASGLSVPRGLVASASLTLGPNCQVNQPDVTRKVSKNCVLCGTAVLLRSSQPCRMPRNVTTSLTGLSVFPSVALQLYDFVVLVLYASASFKKQTF